MKELQVCTACKGECGSYDPCGDDYAMVWLSCQECEGKGLIVALRPDEPRPGGSRCEARKTSEIGG